MFTRTIMKNNFLSLLMSTLLVACASTSETPKGWLTSELTTIVDEEKFNLALNECDYIRAARTAKIDADGQAFLAYKTARDCMEKAGYALK